LNKENLTYDYKDTVGRTNSIPSTQVRSVVPSSQASQ